MAVPCPVFHPCCFWRPLTGRRPATPPCPGQRCARFETDLLAYAFASRRLLAFAVPHVASCPLPALPPAPHGRGRPQLRPVLHLAGHQRGTPFPHRGGPRETSRRRAAMPVCAAFCLVASPLLRPAALTAPQPWSTRAVRPLFARACASQNGTTVLLLACSSGDVDICELLIKAGAVVTTADKVERPPPLCSRGRVRSTTQTHSPARLPPRPARAGPRASSLAPPRSCPHPGFACRTAARRCTKRVGAAT